MIRTVPLFNFAPEADGGGGGDAPVMPEGLPEQFWDASAGQVKLGELVKSHNEAATFKTQHDERAAALQSRKPEDIAFEFTMPADLQVPDGVQFQISDTDPRVNALRELAVRRNLDQETLNDLVALEARHQIAGYVEADKALQEEQRKLGENGPKRVEAMTNFLSANLDQKEYEAVRPFISDAAAFSALEKLIAKVTAQGVATGDLHIHAYAQKKPPQRVADRLYGDKK